MDLSTITTVLKGIGTATDIAKAIKASNQKIEQAELKLKIAELVEALADAKMGVADIRTLLVEKEQEIIELNEKLQIQGNMKYEAPYYWLEDGDKREGPYCQNCYDSNSKLIRLIEYTKGHWECKTCEMEVKGSIH